MRPGHDRPGKRSGSAVIASTQSLASMRPGHDRPGKAAGRYVRLDDSHLGFNEAGA